MFHNLESQNTGLVDFKEDFNEKKKMKGSFCAQSIVIKNVIASEDT